LLPVQLVFIMGAIGLATGVTAALVLVLLRGDVQPAPLPRELEKAAERRTAIAPVFTPEVQFWSPYIIRWAEQYGVDPDILATVIQIESCGQYLISSPAGAQGLFQVMPFHFADGEDPLDPDTNAKRGIGYLIGGLERADGHIGLAMAGYNGGWGVIPLGWGRWARETRNYYIWGSQIYLDALKGVTPGQSAALQDWLSAGGVNLCEQAATVLASATPGAIQPIFGVPTALPTVPPTALPPVFAPTSPAPVPALTPTALPPVFAPPPTAAPTIFIPPSATPPLIITPPPTITVSPWHG
jgi:hypothetical protein